MGPPRRASKRGAGGTTQRSARHPRAPTHNAHAQRTTHRLITRGAPRSSAARRKTSQRATQNLLQNVLASGRETALASSLEIARRETALVRAYARAGLQTVVGQVQALAGQAQALANIGTPLSRSNGTSNLCSAQGEPREARRCRERREAAERRELAKAVQEGADQVVAECHKVQGQLRDAKPAAEEDAPFAWGSQTKVVDTHTHTHTHTHPHTHTHTHVHLPI